MRFNVRTAALGLLGGVALSAALAVPAAAHTDNPVDQSSMNTNCMRMMASNPDMARKCAQMMAADPDMARKCAHGMANSGLTA
ncbi:hypothetical protein GIY23_12640 [Allosaccharopolyspora coralli]|uniref:Uncharacterized protein n=1 Tax=Allosaccharopolyspora coralli TaxID=2665642 RepID=A0A5Q3Q6I4_9PSEU|nr:hypothetical protein [Allosaccharopolyspora coralli]QGK70261.1 hypothetical protein GIY23_12640 [Allosaccharopolyspora coralli]